MDGKNRSEPFLPGIVVGAQTMPSSIGEFWPTKGSGWGMGDGGRTRREWRVVAEHALILVDEVA